jgi:hypothetical protein
MLARPLAVITVALVLPLTYAAAARADVPEGWEVPDDVSFMHTLLVLVLIPLGCMVLLALAIYVPPVVRGESVAPAGVRADDQWFGGRRDAHESAHQAIEQRRETGDKRGDETGGASGSW